MERCTVPLIAAAVYFVLLGIWRLGWLQGPELTLYDSFLRQRPSSSAAESVITVIGLTEQDLQKVEYPLSDRKLAQLLRAIAEGKPRVIGLDIYRDLPEPRSGEGSSLLTGVFRSLTNVIAIHHLPDSLHLAVPPPPALASDPDRIGFNSFPVDTEAGGEIRRGLLYADYSDGTNWVTSPSLALQVARRYLEAEGIWPVPGPAGYLRLGLQDYVPLRPNDGGYVGADTGGYQCLLDFQGPRVFRRFEVSRALVGDIPIESVRDKVVLIGLMTEGVRDEQPSPLGGPIYGVEWHAQFIDQLIRRARTSEPPMRFLKEGWEAALLGIVCVGGAAGVWRVRSAWRVIAMVAIALGLLLGLNQWGLRQGWWIPVVPSILGLSCAASLSGVWRRQLELRERQFLMRLFAKHVSPEIADYLWARRHTFLAGRQPRPQLLQATVLVTDLRDFTATVERLAPAALLLWLNEYMEAMSAGILSRGGVIHEYVGDAILATFGAPAPRTKDEEIAADAQAAVQASLEMAEALGKLNAAWEARGLPTAAMRVGVATGLMVGGSLGSRDRLKYAVVGEVVVSAARLEAFDQEAGDSPIPHCRILVSDSTWQRLDSRFEGRCLGGFVLKGQRNPTTIHHVLGLLKGKEIS